MLPARKQIDVGARLQAGAHGCGSDVQQTPVRLNLKRPKLTKNRPRKG
jgi:hypothetical protein